MQLGFNRLQQTKNRERPDKGKQENGDENGEAGEVIEEGMVREAHKPLVQVCHGGTVYRKRWYDANSMGVVASVCFLVFCALYLMFHELQWPLLGGFVFFFYLERKYTAREESKRYLVAGMDGEVLLDTETVCRPVRFLDHVVFVMRNSVTVLNTADGSRQNFLLPSAAREREPLLHQQSIYLWAGDSLYRFSLDGAMIGQVHIPGAGVVFLKAVEGGVLLSLTSQELILWTDSAQRIVLHSIPVEFLGLWNQRILVCLQNSEIISCSTDLSEFTTLNQPLRPELAGAHRQGDSILAVCQYGPIFHLDFHRLEQGFLPLAHWSREWFTPRMIADSLCFVNKDRQLQFLCGHMNFSILPMNLQGELLFYRFREDGGWIAVESRQGFELIWFLFQDGAFSLKTESFPATFRPLGVKETRLDFASGKDWMQVDLGSEKAVTVGPVLDLSAVFYLGDRTVERRGQKLVTRPDTLVIPAVPSAQAHELQSQGVLGLV